MSVCPSVRPPPPPPQKKPRSKQKTPFSNRFLKNFESLSRKLKFHSKSLKLLYRPVIFKVASNSITRLFFQIIQNFRKLFGLTIKLLFLFLASGIKHVPATDHTRTLYSYLYFVWIPNSYIKFRGYYLSVTKSYVSWNHFLLTTRAVQNVIRCWNNYADGHNCYTLKITCNSSETSKGNQIRMF
jgi:hypothetical protein